MEIPQGSFDLLRSKQETTSIHSTLGLFSLTHTHTHTHTHAHTKRHKSETKARKNLAHIKK